MRAVREAGVAEQITHVSTGGGASLKLLQGEELPALEHLKIDGVKPFIGANWKMNGTYEMGMDYLTALDEGNVNYFGADVVVFPPSPFSVPSRTWRTRPGWIWAPKTCSGRKGEPLPVR